MQKLSKDEFLEILENLDVNYSEKALKECTKGLSSFENASKMVFDSTFRAFSNGFNYNAKKYKNFLALYNDALRYQLSLEGKDKYIPPYADGNVTNFEKCFIYNKVYNKLPVPKDFSSFLRVCYGNPKEIANRIRKGLNNILKKENFDKNSFINIDHIEKYHTQKDDKDPNIVRLVQENENKYESYFLNSFDWQQAILDNLDSKIDDIASIIASGKTSDKFQFNFDKAIGQTITYSFEKFNDSSMQVVIKTDDQVIKEFEEKNQWKKAKFMREKFAKSSLGFQITTVFPLKDENATSSGERLSFEDLQNKYPQDVINLQTPLFRTFAIVKDKFYDDYLLQFQGKIGNPRYQKLSIAKNDKKGYYKCIIDENREGMFIKNGKAVEQGIFFSEMPEMFRLICEIKNCRDYQKQFGITKLDKDVKKEETDKYYSYEFTK